MDTVSAPSAGFLGPHHLVHRPESPEAFLLDTIAPVRQNFVFSAELPHGHALFDDTTAPFHDLLYPVESLRRTALFAARRYFRVPENRETLMVAAGARIDDLGPWRRATGPVPFAGPVSTAATSGGSGAPARPSTARGRTGSPGHIALSLDLTPTDVVRGVPRGMECEATISINGERCGTAEARLMMLTPGVYRSHREAGRRQSTAPGAAPEAGGAPVLPEQVGRRSPANVVVHRPVDGGKEGLRFAVVRRPDNELPAGGGEDELPPALFLEASRQAALHTAAELRGFLPAAALLTGWEARFRGFADADLPLHCTVRGAEPEHGADEAGPGGGSGGGEPAARDAEGRPLVRLLLVFEQGSRVVAEATASVVQDC